MSKTEKFWDKAAKKYDLAEKQFEPVNREVMAKTKSYLNRDDLLLDFGCATGTKTIELASAVKHAFGLDISGGMIREAIQKKEKAAAMNASFSRGSLFDDAFEKASFDAVVAFAVLHLLEDYEKTILRIHELLKPGGIFISTTACFKEKMAFNKRMEVSTYLLLKKLGMFPLHLNLFTVAGIEKLLEDHHFKVVESEKVFLGMTAAFIVASRQTE